MSTSDSLWALVDTVPTIEIACISCISRASARAPGAASKSLESVLTREVLYQLVSRPDSAAGLVTVLVTVFLAQPGFC